MEFKICTKCNKSFPKTTGYFSSHKNHKDGLSSQCKDCKNKASRSYKKNNQDLIRKQNMDYQQNNIAEIRARHRNYQKQVRSTTDGRNKIKIYKHTYKALDYLNGGTYNLEQWKDCLKFFDNRCAYTGEKLNRNNLNVEHIVPLSKDGTNYIWNICPSVNYANFSKKDKNMEEWYKKQEYFTEPRLQKIYAWVEYAKFIY